MIGKVFFPRSRYVVSSDVELTYCNEWAELNEWAEFRIFSQFIKYISYHRCV